MKHNISNEAIFYQELYGWEREESNFLDIEELFHIHDLDLHTQVIRLDSNNRDFFEEIPFIPARSLDQVDSHDLQFEIFNGLTTSRQTSIVEESEEPIEVIEEQRNNKQPKSIPRKNVCFNICQKTIRVIQKNEYQSKLDQICEKNACNKEQFKNSIVREKKNFTGPKALQLYIERETAESQTFKEFMRWFLKEKYLRHCLKGDMNDKEVYIQYKNEVIMAILN